MLLASLLTFHGPFCVGLCRAPRRSSSFGWEREAGVLPSHGPQPLGAAPGSWFLVGTHAALCRRRIQRLTGWGRRAASRSRASCAAPRPQFWPRAHPSLRLPPSLIVTAWALAQNNFLDVFKTAAAAWSLCASGARAMGAQEDSPPQGITRLPLWWVGNGTLDFSPAQFLCLSIK